jgi:DNA-binding response OmpR family regulator
MEAEATLGLFEVLEVGEFETGVPFVLETAFAPIVNIERAMAAVMKKAARRAVICLRIFVLLSGLDASIYNQDELQMNYPKLGCSSCGHVCVLQFMEQVIWRLNVRILLVEDNRRLSDSLRMTLEDDGYAVDAAYDGLDGEEMGLISGYDVIILDIMLPGKDGLEVCRELRNRHISTPILMLTARDAIDDRVRGLDSGADDYLVKPFEVDELRARIRALLRRESPNKSGTIQIADLVLDPATHTVRRGDLPVELTAKEFSLLEYLMRHPNHLITREMAEEHLWSYDHLIASNVVDVYIRRLRRKIDDPFDVKLFETMRGAGYRLRVPEKG